MENLFKRKAVAIVLSLVMVFQMGIPAFATGETLPIGTSSVCTHHTHDAACGYTEGTPCIHEHTEECYTEVTNCTHEHTDECYPDGVLPATGSDAAEPTECTHECNEDTGCITKELNCKHTHDEACGYTEGTSCNFDPATCESCNPKDSGTATDKVQSAVEQLIVKIDALPNAGEITDENRESVKADFEVVFTEYDKLSADESIIDLDGQLGAERMAKLTALRGVLLEMVTLAGEVYGLLKSDGEVYTTNANGTQTDGEITDKKTITNLFVAGDVTSIGASAFSSCTNLKTVDLSKAASLETIGDEAFYNTGITSVTIPENVTSIEYGAFYYCTNLTNVDLSNAAVLQTIGAAAFNDTGMTSVTIPASVTSIESAAFYGCAKLTTVDLSNAAVLQTIGESAFGDTGMTSVTIPASVTSIESVAFDGCAKLTTVDLSKAASLETIGDEAFSDTGITSVTIPETVTSISDYVFDNCTNLKTVTFKAIVPPEFGTSVFNNCNALEEIYVPNSGVEAYKNAANFTEYVGKISAAPVYALLKSDGKVYTTNADGSKTDGTEITEVGTVTNLFVANDVTSIDMGKFWIFTALTDVTMPNVTSIGEWAFGNLSNLTNVSMPKVTSIGDNAFTSCTALESITLGATPPTVGALSEPFQNCPSPRNLTIMGNTTFETEVLNAYKADSDTNQKWYGWTLPATIDGTNVSDSTATLEITSGNANPMFGEDNEITFTATFAKAAAPAAESMLRTFAINEVQFKDGETPLGTASAQKDANGNWVAALTVNTNDTAKWTVGEYSITAEFAGNHDLKATTTTSPVKVTVTEVYAVYNGTGFFAATEEAPTTATTTEIADKTTINHLYIDAEVMQFGLMDGCTNIKTVTCSNKVTEIGGNAFYGCTQLQTVSMPEVTEIGGNAFILLTQLQTVSMPKVTKIGATAFYGCTALKSLDLSNVTEIGVSAFGGCTALKSLDLSNVTTIGISAFDNCTALTEVTMPKVDQIGDNAFRGCSALTKSEMPETTTIGEYAFDRCGKLVTAIMPKVTSIGTGAFSACSVLTTVTMPNVATISDYAFYSCEKLNSITLGATPPSVGENAFSGRPATRNLTISGNTAFQDEVLAAYKAADDGNTGDNKWYGWTLPATIDGTNVSDSTGTLTATAGKTDVAYSEANTITFTASFAKIGDSKLRTAVQNQITLMNGSNIVESKAATLTDGVYSATFTVDTSALNAGKHNYTATFDGNASLVGSTATETVVVTINKVEQAALVISGVPQPVTYGNGTFNLSTSGGSVTGGKVTYAVTAGDAVSVADTGVVTILKAGTATITATKAGDTNYKNQTGTVEITVQAAAPTLTWGNTAQTTTYTGREIVESALTAKPTVTLKSSDTFSGTIQYAYKYVGGLTRGLFEGYTDGLPTNAGKYEIKAHIAESADGNYTAADSTNVMTLTITKSTPTLTIDTMNGKTYDGTAVSKPAAGDMTITGVNYADVAFAYSKNNDMSIPLATAPKDAGTYYVQANVKATDNTEAATSAAKSFTIGKASATGVSQEYLVVKGLAKEYDFTLANLLPSITATQEFGTVSYTVGTVTNTDNVLTKNPTDSDIADGKLKLSVANVADKDKTAAVTITITTDNFTVTNAVITVKTVDKKPLTISNVAMPNREYNAVAYSYEGTPTFTDNSDSSALTGVSFTKEYEGKGTTSYAKSTTAPTNAGSYNLILTVSGESANTYIGSITVPFEITKKEVTVTAKDKDILVGGSVPDLSNPVLGTDYTTDGFVGGDTLGGTVSMSYTGIPDNTQHGAYPITVSGGTVSDNYTVKYVSGTLSITIDVTVINTAITAANEAKTGITISDSTASSVQNGTKFVTTAEMNALDTAIQTATDAKATVTTLAQAQAAATALDEAVAIFKAAIKTGTYTSGGGSSSGGSSSGGSGNSTVTTPPATTENPKPATEVTTTVKPTVSNGTATVNVSNDTINSAIEKAQAEAKKNGTTTNGIVVEIKVDTKGTTASNLSANLPKASVDALVKAKATEVRISSGIADIHLNLDTLKEIQKQIGVDVNVTAKKVDNSALSTEAKKLVGSRPVYDFSITGTNGKKLTDFGKGKVSVSIPYTLGKNENPANIVAYYIDNAGKATEMPNSVYDPIAKTLSFVTDHFSKFAVGYKEVKVSFTDTAKHWAKDSIEFVAARGILAGTGDNKFSPNTAMTRGMFVTALGRLAEADVSKYTKSSFTDVKADAYYMGYVEWANKNDIVNGVGNDKFAPDQRITREQMAVIMQNYAKAIGFELPKVHAENTFADNAKIGSYAKNAVKAMQMAGILSGKDGNKFDPQGTATRAEVSAVLKRFVELAINSDNAQGWTVNDSGKWMYYENGKAVTGKKNIDGTTYTFDQYGVTADVPKNRKTSIYVVQTGDSFWRIAYKQGCTIKELELLNNKNRFSIIHPGDELIVPEK